MRKLLPIVYFVMAAGLYPPAHAASPNSCANVEVIRTFDRNVWREFEFGIYAVGTFRVADEEDESRQPNFNLATINCDLQTREAGKEFLECKVTKAVVQADSANPNTDIPNCALDLDSSTYEMRLLQPGIYTGMGPSTDCFNSNLTVDRSTRRVNLSFTRTPTADGLDKISPGACATQPRPQVLMNCTRAARTRKGAGAPARYCDFGSAE